MCLGSDIETVMRQVDKKNEGLNVSSLVVDRKELYLRRVAMAGALV